MYKRKTRSGNLGIVRTISKTQQNISNKSENISPNKEKEPTVITAICETTRPTKSFQCDDDPDEIHSDSEPSPKRSRRFLNSSSSSFMKGLSNSNIKITPGKNTIHQTSSSVQSSTQSKGLNNTKSLKASSTQQSKNNVQKCNAGSPLKNTVGLTKKNPNGDRPTGNSKKSYLEELFEKSGLLLSDGNSPNVLKTDQAIFIRDINNVLACEERELKTSIEYIMKDLEEYCSNDKCLKYAVSCTETSSECDVSRGASQDSLMRLLLHVTCLQAQVTELLIDKLGKFVMDGNSDDDETSIITWVRMILQCFRFLDRMDNGTLVNERLLDIVLATSNITIQQEVIISLPDIISDAEHHHAALELSKLVRKGCPHLMGSALEALTNLSLQPEVRAQIQPILMKALNKAQPEFLPTIIKFLFTDSDMSLLNEIITYLRNELDLSELNGDVASIQVLVFSTLRDALLASRTLPNVWQKNISSVKLQAEHKPMDVLMLLVLLSTTNDLVRQKSIEAIFRNKIRCDLFIEPLINETLQNYIAVIKEYFHVTIKLAGSLLKSTEPTIVDFAAKIYIRMFVNMDGLWCKWVLSDLQECVGAGDTNVARSALNVLQHLTNKHHHKVKPLGVILMLLLNKLNDLALNQVCQLMDILCHIAYSEDDSTSSDCSILQDEINILVQKQLASSQLSILRNGVIGCVMTIKHTASVAEDNSESIIPDESSEKTKKATQLLEMLLSSTRNCVEVHGLALDQLSHLLLSGTILESSFIQKLSCLMRDNLQVAFLISASDFVSKSGDVLKSSLQFYLDDDIEESIVLNLCELVTMESDSTQPKPMMGVSCVHPLLRLLRGLELSDLSEIDALLGCAIVMPLPAMYSNFSNLTPYQQNIALHCLFHCINWFHEIINCFAFLVKKKEPEKVLVRLRTIVWLRSLLNRCLPLAMEYTPPTCHFQALLKPKLNSAVEKGTTKKRDKKKIKKKSKKKQPNEESVLTGNENTSQAAEEEEEESVEEKTADLSKYKQYFRELDIDVWLILTQPLTLSPTPEKGGVFTAELGPNELLFLLDDYVVKLSHSLTSSNKRISFLKTTQNQNVGFENLDKFTPLHVAKNTIKLLSFLCSFLEKTIEYTQNLMKLNDGVFDATGMFLEGSAEVKKCQGKLLRILAILFSWVGFQNQANSSYLLAALQQVASRMSSEQASSKSKKLLVRECVYYLTQCHEYVLDLISACTLVDVIKALVHQVEADLNLKTGVATMCLEFLGRRWYDLKGDRVKGAELNSGLSELLSGYFSHSEDQLAAVTTISIWLNTESQQLTDKDSSLSTFPSFSRVNLHLLVGGLLKGLEGAVKQKLDNQLSDKEQLDLWSSFTQCLETLVTVVKAHDSKPNLRVFMKGITTVLKLFLSHGMSTCTFMFKHEPDIVSHILKKLQVTTRYVQTVCNFVKVSKDAGLIQFLPSIRAVMETIILRVKSIIVINNCADAFFMGSMKNRDLKGQEIPSQEIQPEEEEEVESIQNETNSESEKEDKNSANETDNEEDIETGESISI